MPYQWNWLDGSRRHLSHISKGTACESIIKLIHKVTLSIKGQCMN